MLANKGEWRRVVRRSGPLDGRVQRTRQHAGTRTNW